MTSFFISNYVVFEVSKNAVCRFSGYRAKFLKIPFIPCGILFYSNDQKIIKYGDDIRD